MTYQEEKVKKIIETKSKLEIKHEIDSLHILKGKPYLDQNKINQDLLDYTESLKRIKNENKNS